MNKLTSLFAFAFAGFASLASYGVAFAASQTTTPYPLCPPGQEACAEEILSATVKRSASIDAKSPKSANATVFPSDTAAQEAYASAILSLAANATTGATPAQRGYKEAIRVGLKIRELSARFGGIAYDGGARRLRAFEMVSLSAGGEFGTPAIRVPTRRPIMVN